MLSEYLRRYVAEYSPYKGGAWCYEDGCIYRGLQCLYEATGDGHWRAEAERLIAPQLGDDGALLGYLAGDFNIDNIQSGRALLWLEGLTGEARYLRGAERLIAQLAEHPRTESGVYWHKARYPWQVWLDGLYMGVTFQLMFARRVGDSALEADVWAQLAAALASNRSAGLFAHGFDEKRAQPWADPETGQSAAHWARALGWLAMALVDLAEMGGEGTPEFVGREAQALFDRLLDLRAENGLWLQVIDQPDLPGNYAESSASAMFAYAMLKGARIGLVPGDAALRARLVPELVAACVTGTPPAMTQICEVAGLGPFENRYRDGSAAYYISEPLVSDDSKGVGPLMMALSEHALARGARSIEMGGAALAG